MIYLYLRVYVWFLFRIALAIPKSEGGFEKCRVYAVNFTEVVSQGINQSDTSWPIKQCGNGWEYNFTKEEMPYATIATEVSVLNFFQV